MFMNSESVARIICELPLDSELAVGIEAALANPRTNVLLIEFHRRPDSERIEVDQILAGDPLIDRLRSLLRKMEQGLKPIVALVFESLDGLQLEIALACHARLASSQAIKLGFPWLKYGLMPILGGTQRLPRLCGIGLAARLLLQGERVAAAEGAGAGLIALSHHSLPEAALEWTKAHPEPRQPWDRVPPELSPAYSQSPSNRLVLEKIYLKLRHRVTPEETAPTAILRCLQDGLERSIDAGIRLEAEQWSLVRRSRSTVSRVNTLHVARQKAIGRIVNQPISIKCLGVLGGGLMGTGIAYTAARAGCEVVLVDNSQAALDVSFHRAQKLAQQDANSDLLKNGAPADILNRIHQSLEIGALARCDFIVEAIFEREILKKAMLAAIAKLADPRAIIGSNTTTLPISDLASACSYPARFLGTHFFAPVDRMELLEIVVGEKTAPETIDRALVLAKALEKTPVIVRDGPGFFTSRVVAAYLQEALLMLREGVSPWLIDNVAQNAGMILGPLTVADLTSLDLLTDIFGSLAMHRRGAARYAPESIVILQELTSRSRLGRKSRAGIYDYNSSQERVDSPEFARIFVPAADQPPAEEIERRLFVIQTLEALHATREGILEDAAMADLASVLGWNYPAHRGGVMSYVDFIGRAEFERVRAGLQRKFGDRFALPG
jgi:3-hydroxyacyl-CoA dehydrogenase / enoyl-CoA hydratase / 3-hydroxybutyryl-CoA epimerase